MEGVDPRFVFKIRAESGLSDEDILERRQLHILGNDDSSTYFVLAGDGGRAFAEALDRYSRGEDVEGGRAELSSLYNKIDRIEPYGPSDRRGPGLDVVDAEASIYIDVTLWPSEDTSEAQARMELLELHVHDLGGDITARSVSPRFTVARCIIDGGNITQLLELYVIETARVPPTPYLDPSDWYGVEAETLEVERLDGEAIGVLDDRPDAQHPVLSGLVSLQPEADLGREWLAPTQHGTMVSGLAIAPLLASDLKDGRPIRAHGRVVATRVLERDPSAPNEPTRFPPEILPSDLITSSIRKMHDEEGVRVFNLSFGYDLDYSPSHVGELSEMLDDLIRELSIVVVVAAGNALIRLDGSTPSGHHVHHDYPTYLDESKHGIAQPANAALALTVGGIAHSDAPTERTPPRLGQKAVAAVGHLSPFSRTGPGHGRLANRINKPDLVAPAGNVVVDDTGSVLLRDLGTGVLSTASRPEGPLFQVGHGTSFAAPVVAGDAAAVIHQYRNASANLVRALLAAAAVPPLGAQPLTDHAVRHKRYGFGVVRRPDATESRAQRLTMVFDGEMTVDTSVIHPVPIPKEFALPRSATRAIRIALAFDPPVRRTRREYTAATIVTDAYRAVSLEELESRLVQQDPDDPQPLFNDRRRIKQFEPPHTAHRESTLQVKEWRPRKLDIDDGDEYFIVVTHKSRTWFRNREDYTSQRYALAVSLVDESMVELDLPLLVRQSAELRSEARVAR